LHVRNYSARTPFPKGMRTASHASHLYEYNNVHRAPEDDVGMVEFFLDTPAEDLEYEVVKYRPRLSPSFFK